jgi:hypothetical protein
MHMRASHPLQTWCRHKATPPDNNWQAGSGTEFLKPASEAGRRLARLILRESQRRNALKPRCTMHILRAYTLPIPVTTRVVVRPSRCLDLFVDWWFKHAVWVCDVLEWRHCCQLSGYGAVDGAAGVQESPIDVLAPMHAALVPACGCDGNTKASGECSE